MVLWILAGFYLSVFWPSRKSSQTEFEELVAIDFECSRECKLYGSIMLSLAIQNVVEQTFSKDSTSAFAVISRFDSPLSLSSSVGLYWAFCPEASWQGSPLNCVNTCFLDVWRWGRRRSQLSQWSLDWVYCWARVGEEAGDCNCIREKQIPVCLWGTHFPSHSWYPSSVALPPPYFLHRGLWSLSLRPKIYSSCEIHLTENWPFKVYISRC